MVYPYLFISSNMKLQHIILLYSRYIYLSLPLAFMLLDLEQRHQSCSLSMNGCQADPRPAPPIGTIETRTFPAVLTPALAMDRLNSAISDMKSEPPPFHSGIIRLEVTPTHNTTPRFL
ncbi:hypothetical protein CsSME_00053474 [Camellia sinensis var. sinensis]